MATNNKMIRIASLFMAMLIVSISCVTVVSSKADNPQNNMVVLKTTDKEKVISVTKKDGSIEYGISWKDEKNPNKIHFAVVEQKEQVRMTYLFMSHLYSMNLVHFISYVKY